MARNALTIWSSPGLAITLLGAVGAVILSRPVRAEAVPSEQQPATVDARAFVGFGSGVAVDAWLPGRYLRIGVDAQTGLPSAFDWGGLVVVVPVAGRARNFFGLRAGDTLEYTATRDGWVSGSRFAHAPDVGVLGHLESAAGSTIEGQLGVEAVLRREVIVCCDHAALPTSSFGVRIALRGELALSPRWALVAQAGLRSADHLLEIHVLPTFVVGIRVRL